jgi:DNA-binding response OmpR family regulator
MSPIPYVLVVGHGRDLESEVGAATQLRQLGANVVTLDFWDDFAHGCESDAPCRAIVIEAGDRPDFAISALRSARREEKLRDAPALLAITDRQVARVEPSSGFDDFIVAPYRPAELYARIRHLEWKNSEFSTEERLKVGGVVVDKAAHEVTVDGRRVTMTAKEFALLAFFAANRGRVFGREALLARVWGVRYEGGARTVDIHVRRLRAKLGDALPLETLRGTGYKLRAPDELPTEDDAEPEEPASPLVKGSVARAIATRRGHDRRSKAQ